MHVTKSRSVFVRIAKAVSRGAGHPRSFAIAFAMILLWAFTGPVFGFGDTWQLVVNTATSVMTFLMVFLIQNTQNRDSEAIQVKLDELIRASRGAHLALLDLEELEDRELEQIRARYVTLAEQARKDLGEGKDDTDTPEVPA